MANNDTESRWSILKRTVKKIRFLLGGVDITGWRLASLLRGPAATTIPRLSFNDRVGLQGFIDDESNNHEQRSFDENENSSERVFQRSASYVSASSSDDDIDRRAEIFISNFRRQLRLERQISLELRYCRPPSFTSSSSSSPTP